MKNCRASSFVQAADLLQNKDPSSLIQSQDRLAILGFPVTHSASPAMQNAALEASQLPYRYIPIEVKPGENELEFTVQMLTQLGFLGFNVTLPHKQAIIPYLDEISDHAAFLGAVNTIVIRDGKVSGTNTDGPGLITAVKETWGVSLSDQRILILGATGGVGRAIAAQCVLEQCHELYLASRTPSALEPQINSLSHHAGATIPIKAIGLNNDTLASIMPHVDLIVNATSVGMNNKDLSLIPSNLFHANQFLYDTIYSSGETALMQAASKAGARVADGHSMLLHQGALAFELWFGKPAPLEVMRQALFMPQIPL